MNQFLAKVRAQLPQYADIPDQELMTHIHDKFYSQVPFEDFARAAKYDITETAPGVLRNLGLAAEQGIVGVGGSVGDVLERTGIAPETGRYLQDNAMATQEELGNRKSFEWQQDAAQPLFDENNDINPDYNWSALGDTIAQSIPGMVATVPVGGLFAKAAANTAKTLGVGAKLSETVGSALGFGAAEGQQAASQNAMQKAYEIRNTPFEKLMNSEAFQTAYWAQDQTLPIEQRLETARESVAKQAGDQVFATTLATTGGIGAATGGGMLGMARNKLLGQGAKESVKMAALKGMGIEMGQEFPQSWQEAINQNMAQRDFVNPDQDIYKGALNQAATGALAGGAMGMFGGVSAIGRAKTADEAIDAFGEALNDEPIINKIEPILPEVTNEKETTQAANTGAGIAGEIPEVGDIGRQAGNNAARVEPAVGRLPEQDQRAAGQDISGSILGSTEQLAQEPADAVPLTQQENINGGEKIPSEKAHAETGKTRPLNQVAPGQPGAILINQELPNNARPEQPIPATDSGSAASGADVPASPIVGNDSATKQNRELTQQGTNAKTNSKTPATAQPAAPGASEDSPGIAQVGEQPQEAGIIRPAAPTAKKAINEQETQQAKGQTETQTSGAQGEVNPVKDYFAGKGFNDTEINQILAAREKHGAKVDGWGRVRFGKARATDVDFKYSPTIRNQKNESNNETAQPQNNANAEAVSAKAKGGTESVKVSNSTPLKQKRSYKVINDSDDLLAAISKLGGISLTEAKAQGIDPKMSGKRGSGILRVFNNGVNSQSYDGMAEALRQYGFDTITANDLVDKVSRAINQGEKIYNPIGHELHAEAMAAEEFNSKEAQKLLQYESLLETAKQHDDDFGTDFLSILLKQEDMTNDDLNTWEQDLHDDRTDRYQESLASGKASVPKEELKSYTEAELSAKEREQKQRDKQSAEAELKSKQKAQADNEVDTFADEMLGNIGTNDIFGGNPLANLGRAEKVVKQDQSTDSTDKGKDEFQNKTQQPNKQDSPAQKAMVEKVQSKVKENTEDAEINASGNNSESQINKTPIKSSNGQANDKQDQSIDSNEQTSPSEVTDNIKGGDLFSKDDIPYKDAERAYMGISHSPEKRAQQEQDSYVQHMQNVYDSAIKYAKTDEQKIIINEAFLKYKEGFIKKTLAHLSAKSKVMSPMITGPANFPVNRNNKANATEHKRLEELLEYDKRGQERLRKIALDSRSSEEIAGERQEQINKRIASSLDTIKGIDNGSVRGSSRPLFVSSITGTIKTLSKNGETDLVNGALDFIENYQKYLTKPLIGPKNSIWLLRDKTNEAIEAVKKERGTIVLKEYEGASVVNNNELDRVQILFDEKPSAEVRDALKTAAFKWSPNNNSWQRQNTTNGISAAKHILDGLYQAKETDKGVALYSKSNQNTQKPHTEQSLTQAMRKVMDGKFGDGWFNRLLATGKFKIVSMEQAKAMIGGQVKFHKVWHGSLHDHNGFDSNKIGTGEGSQAFGYGHYFTDAKAIAEHYRKEYSKNGDIVAFYNPANDTSYFFHDSISQNATDSELQGLINHEVAVHQLRLLRSDDEFKALLEKVEAMSKIKGSRMAAAAARVPEDTNPEHVSEEILAYFSEQHIDHSITQKLIQLIRKALRSFAKFMPPKLRGKWFVWANTLSENDLIDMATDALRTAPTSLQFDNAGRHGDSIRFEQEQQRFYSALRKAFRDAPDKIFTTPQQIKLWLNSNASKFDVKKDEIYWSGVNDWLDTLTGKISKDDVLSFLNANGVQVDDVVLGGKDADMAVREWLDDTDANVRFDEEEDGWIASYSDSDIREVFDSEESAWEELRNEAISQINEYQPDSPKSAKHNTEQLTLPGGSDYRELVLTIPTTEPYKADDETHFGDVSGGKHIAWVRMNSRTDAKGNTTQFLEEVQSQRGADGRKSGFAKPAKKYIAEPINPDKIHTEDWVIKDDNGIVHYRGSRQMVLHHIDDYNNNRIGMSAAGSVPPAPFITDSNSKATNAYIALVMKKAVSVAIDAGSTSVSWTTGDQQSERYDLSKQISSVEYIPDNKTLRAFDLSGKSVIDQVTEPDKVEDYVGKEVAKRLFESEPELTGSGKKIHRVEGGGLKIGGSWTKAMYGDENGLNAQGQPALITQAAGAIAKKFGGKIGTVKLDIGIQPALIITPEMKAKVLNEGMPLFSKTNAINTSERLAPNGKPSNLNAVQYAQVRTPEFKKWFGDWENDPENASKAVDDNGEPLVVYHGTNKSFDEFDVSKAGTSGVPRTGKDKVLFFTDDKDEAIAYAQMAFDWPSFYEAEKNNNLTYMEQYAYGSRQRNIMPVFLRLINPINEDAKGRVTTNRDRVKSALKYIKSHGGDGIVIRNTKLFNPEENPSTIYVALDPNQIKSAIGNTGAFNPKSSDIRFSKSSDAIAKAKDFVSGNDRNVNSLSDIDKILATGKMPQDKIDMQSVLDKAATLFVDSSRPFDVWTRKLNNSIRAGELIFAKDRAKRRTAIFEKQAMDDYLHPLAKVIDTIAKKHDLEYRAAKELAGQWMTARYAIEKNNDYIRQDQKAVDDAQAALDEKLEQDKKDLAQGKIDLQPANGDLKSALTKAKNKQQDRLSAIHEQRRIDPTEEAFGVGLAGGYNNFTAKLYMDAIEGKIKRSELEEAANHVYDMLTWKLNKDLENGKVTQAMVDTWQNSRYYVPLTGDPSVDESDDPLFSHGSLNQKSDKKAEGRKGSIAQNGIDAATEQVQKSARYHGWLDFKDKFTEIYNELIQTELDDGLTQREAQRAVSDKYGIDRRPENGLTRPSDSGLIIRRDGKSWVYDINDTSAIDALRSVNKEDTPSILQPIAFFTRSYARMVTQFLPGFGTINAIRDTWERSENIRTRALPGYESIDMDKVAKEAIRTAANPKLVKKLMGIMFEGTRLESKFSVDDSDPDIQIIREMIKEGGTSTVGDYLNATSATLAKQMKDSLKLSTEAMNVVSAWNNSFELVSSYSIYKALRNAGVDKKIAASGTLNLMNFGKHGTVIGPLKALYVFTNPTMQGGHQMLMTLGTKKGKARAAAYLIAGTVLYTMLRAGDDDDETGINRTDQLGNFVLERNIPIKVPGTNEYIKIPIGFGMPQAMWSTAVNISKFMFGDQSAVDSGAEILKSFSRTLAPVQPSETSISKHPLIWMTQTFSPQVIKPMVNIALDVNTFGSPLTNSRFQKPDVSNALHGRKSTPEEYKEIAQELAKFGIDLYPEQVREIIKGYAVGPMNEITKAVIENPHKEGLGRDTISPVFDRIIAVQDTSSLKERLYYRYRDEMNEAAVKESVGEELSPREKQLAKLVVVIKKLENKANGKMAAATKQEKGKSGKFKSPYRKQAESIRDNAMKIVFNKMKVLNE